MSEIYLKQLWIYDQKPPLQNHKIKMHYFRFDGFSFGGLLEYILQHTLAKFQPAMTCNSQNTSQNTQKHQKHAILLSKPVALYTPRNYVKGKGLTQNPWSIEKTEGSGFLTTYLACPTYPSWHTTTSKTPELYSTNRSRKQLSCMFLCS